jgi:hypothetical protein
MNIYSKFRPSSCETESHLKAVVHCTRVRWETLQRKTWCMGPYVGADYNTTSHYVYSRVYSNTFTTDNPMLEST